jgi:hypothetical protein
MEPRVFYSGEMKRKLIIRLIEDSSCPKVVAGIDEIYKATFVILIQASAPRRARFQLL